MNKKHLFLFFLCSFILIGAFATQYKINNINYYNWVVENHYKIISLDFKNNYNDYLTSAENNLKYNPLLTKIQIFSIIIILIFSVLLTIELNKPKELNTLFPVNLNDNSG